MHYNIIKIYVYIYITQNIKLLTLLLLFVQSTNQMSSFFLFFFVCKKCPFFKHAKAWTCIRKIMLTMMSVGVFFFFLSLVSHYRKSALSNCSSRGFKWEGTPLFLRKNRKVVNRFHMSRQQMKARLHQTLPCPIQRRYTRLKEIQVKAV